MLTGDSSLGKRPMKRVIDPLLLMGSTDRNRRTAVVHLCIFMAEPA